MLCAAVFLGALDQTVVVTALPAVIEDLQIPFQRLDDAAWIVSAYLLGYTVGMPLVGRMSDVFGRQPVIVASLILLGLTSIACGVARSLEWLVVARGVQAVGGGALLPVTLAVVGDIFPEQRRGVLLGTVAATAEAGGVLGPLWGAAILSQLHWSWAFFINVPLVLLLLVAVRLAPAPSRRGRGTVDRRGALGVVKSLPFAAANLVSLLSGVALIVAMVDVPLWSATILQRSAVDGGLLLMRLTAAIPVGAVIGGVLLRRLGPAALCAVGTAWCGVAMLLLAQWRVETDELQMTRDLLLGGLGFGLQLAPIASVVMAWAGAASAGVATALATVMRMIGMLLGVSTLTSWGLDRFNALVAGLPLPLPVPGEAAEATQQRLLEYQSTITNAGVMVFGEIFSAAAIVCLLAIAPALLMRMPRQ